MRFFLLSLLGLLSSLGVTTFRLNVRRTLADVAVGNRQRSCKLADTPSTTTPNYTVSSSSSIINDNEVPLPSYSSSKSTATSTSSRKYTRPGKVAVSVEETLRTPAAVSMDTDPSQVIFSKRFDHSSSSSGSSGSTRIPSGDVAGSSYTTSSTIHGPPFKSSNRYTPTNVLGGMTGESGRKPWKSRKDPMNIESVGVYPTNFYRNVAYDHLAPNSLGAIEALPAMRFSKVNLDLLSDTLSHTLTYPYRLLHISTLHRPLTSSPSPPLTLSLSLPPSPPLITLRARAI